jgi:hypothetical protein
MYLPGRGEEHYALNVSSIIHDVEGHWFYASDAWQRLVMPLVDNVIAANGPSALPPARVTTAAMSTLPHEAKFER